jgi:hypothetical protein
MKKYFVVLMMALTAVSGFAKDYYCAPNGTGDGSSYEKAGSFTSLVQTIGAGDVLYCRGGQYDFSNTINISKQGTKEKPVCIFNVPGEKPIFDFRKQAYGSRGIEVKNGTTYLHIKGLTIRYTGKNALHNSGSYCTFENLETYGNGDTGIQMKAGGNNLILNCDSHDNFDYQLENDYGGNADGFADKQYTGGSNIYRGCRAWNNSDDGWDFFDRVSQDGTVTVLENCVCYNNGPKEYDMRNHPRYETDKAWFQQFEGSGKQVTFRKSETPVTVTVEHYLNNGNGNGFKLGGNYSNNVVRVVNCLAVANTERGFDQNNNNGTMEVYNCTAYKNGSDFNFSTENNGVLIIKNCLTPGGAHVFRCREVTDENNSWNISGITCTEADFQSTDYQGLILFDRQADGSLTETPLLRLVEGSDMIDKGVILPYPYPYGGSAPDLGCFESGELTYPAVVSCSTGNQTQSIKEGQAVKDIVVTWSGSAKGAAVEGLPDGMTVQKDEAAKTITISGTPTQLGKHEITIATQQDEGVTGMSMTVTITVREDFGVELAYVTIPSSAADAPVLEALRSMYNVTEVNANTSNVDYSSYDLVVISSVPGSNLTGMSQLKGVAKPVLLLKPWVMKNGVWSWGTAQNTQDAAMRIVKADHPIFKDVTITDGQVTFLGQVTTNGVTYISAWTNASGYTEIATPLAANGQSIFELPAGGNYNGTTLTDPLLCIGLSEYSMASLTGEGKQVVANACKYLLGEMTTGISQLTIDNSQLTIKAGAWYTLDGRRLSGKPTQKGIYIHNGKKVVR